MKHTTMKMILLSAALCTSAAVFAQSGIQIRGGLNRANISVTENGRVNEANTVSSYQIGFLADVKLGGPIYLQPGILYTGKGSKVERGTEGSNGYLRQTFNPYYIELPVNLVGKLPLGENTRVFAGAGPYLAVGVRGKATTKMQTLGQESSFERDIRFSSDDPTTLDEEEGAGFGIVKRFDYGLNGTAGIEGKSLVLSVNYGLGMAKLQSGANNSDNSNKHRVLSFTLGIKM